MYMGPYLVLTYEHGYYAIEQVCVSKMKKRTKVFLCEAEHSIFYLCLIP